MVKKTPIYAKFGITEYQTIACKDFRTFFLQRRAKFGAH